MTIWTVHARPGAAPVLVREGFSWAALLFGPLWLLACRAWIPAILAIAAGLAVTLAPSGWGGLLDFGLAVCLGLFGRDLWRWSLDRRGFLLTDVVTGADEEAALARLLERRPELAQAALLDAFR